MSDAAKPFIRKFDDGEPYAQPSGPNGRFNTLLPKGIVGDLNVGRVRMTGPSWNEPGAHEWSQLYLVLAGSGTMVIGDSQHPVAGPTVIQIPTNTEHYMKVAEGERIEYLYVNQFPNE